MTAGYYKTYGGLERRKFVRLDYVTPLACKVCKKETLFKIFEGYTIDVSQAGLQCYLKDSVQIDDIVWLSFDRGILHICEELEKSCLIYQNGVIGKVVRVAHNDDNTHNVGIHFIIRSEKNARDINLISEFIK
jgi:hypothetical protein